MPQMHFNKTYPEIKEGDAMYVSPDKRGKDLVENESRKLGYIICPGFCVVLLLMRYCLN